METKMSFEEFWAANVDEQTKKRYNISNLLMKIFSVAVVAITAAMIVIMKDEMDEQVLVVYAFAFIFSAAIAVAAFLIKKSDPKRLMAIAIIAIVFGFLCGFGKLVGTLFIFVGGTASFSFSIVRNVEKSYKAYLES